MTDPNTDEPTRTWEQMEIPEREVPDGDPFTYFTGGNPDDDPDF